LIVLQINTSVNIGSTGRIAEDLGRILITSGHESYIAFGRQAYGSNSNVIKIGCKVDHALHVIQSRLLDRHGFGSTIATKLLVKHIEKINPDIVHLHNIHGYYLHVLVLFDYLKSKDYPVIWTFHDCWPFTGHCSYFDAVNCYKWQSICNDCPNKHGYPTSWFLDNSSRNFLQKEKIFNGLNNMILVSPSQWMAQHLRNSFLGNYNIKVINNGIDLKQFRPVYDKELLSEYNLNDQYVLGVASTWDKRKGLEDFIKLRNLIPAGIIIILIGLSSKQINKLPNGIIGIKRTRDIAELAQLYSQAVAFINPTYVDNFPTTNIEALACGTPVITYDTGGSPEAIDDTTGFIVKKGDIEGLANAIYKVFEGGSIFYQNACRLRAEKLFSRDERFGDYLELYQNAISNNNESL